MMVNRPISVIDDDKKLFHEEMGDVEPLNKTADRVDLKKTAEKIPGLAVRRRDAQQVSQKNCDALSSEEYIVMVKPRDVLSFKRDGVQHGVFKNLRLGKYPLDFQLDLHRMTVVQARQQVFQFIRDCIKHNIRCALITHGRGENREKPALLKSCTNHWLQQLNDVLAFHSAQSQHGGTGSTYVLLRKTSEKSSEKRERHQ
ncbi:MAG: DNA endonuclease SmrA, partial [Porticoccus sp.]